VRQLKLILSASIIVILCFNNIFFKTISSGGQSFVRFAAEGVTSMNDIIIVKKEKCLKDGLCVADCPLNLLTQDKDGYPVPVEEAGELCIDCGHCVAVCPSGALDQRWMAAADCRPIQKGLEISAEHIEQYLCSRRSIRQYLQKQVEDKKIKKLLAIAGYAPSGHNVQPARWLVITDVNQVRRLAGLVADWLGMMIKDQPDFAARLHMDKVLAAWDKGQDLILRNAPHLLIAYAPKNERTAPAAIVSAIAYLEIAAPSLGLGTCWAGYFLHACQAFGPLLKALALPEDHIVYGAVMLGYHKAEYHRVPLRKPPDIRSVDSIYMHHSF